ncbi:MAG: hypothetical protein KF855_05395 [Acidobacteria bacterium]|nr:hypothetical protein [Acidobacteriota bacterium]
MKITLFLAVLLLTSAVQAQMRTFVWQTDMCEMSGQYDPSKYTEEQLRNTLALFGPDEISLSARATVWNFSEIESLDVAKLDSDHKQMRERIATMPIVNSPYWENARKAKLRELDQVYALSRATMQAYTKPAVLRDYDRSPKCKADYGEPIVAGGDSLIAAWRKVNEASQSRNVDPERLKQRFETQLASPERLQFALVETMAFGWWNCANQDIEYDEDAQNGKHSDAFTKLFTNVKSVCDEP